MERIAEEFGRNRRGVDLSQLLGLLLRYTVAVAVHVLGRDLLGYGRGGGSGGGSAGGNSLGLLPGDLLLLLLNLYLLDLPCLDLLLLDPLLDLLGLLGDLGLHSLGLLLGLTRFAGLLLLSAALVAGGLLRGESTLPQGDSASPLSDGLLLSSDLGGLLFLGLKSLLLSKSLLALLLLGSLPGLGASSPRQPSW